MPMVDPDTMEVSQLATATDTATIRAGQPSIFDNIGDLVTKGAPLAAISAINGYANTAIELGNWTGATDAEKLTPKDWEVSQDTQDYYDQHHQGVDAAGLILGSLVPGTLAVKAFKAATAGRLGEAALATNLFGAPAEDVVQGAAQALSKGSDINASLRAEKLGAIAYGAADNVLQGMVYEAATLATSKANPILDDNGVRDTVGDLLTAGVTQGVIGGLFGAFSTLGKFKNAKLEVGDGLKDFAGTDRLGALQTKFDGGDRAATIISSLDDVSNAKNSLEGPATPLQKITGERTYDKAINDAKLALTDIVPNQRVASDLIDGAVARLDGTDDTRNSVLSTFQRLTRVDSAADVDKPYIPDSGNLVYIGRNFEKGASVTLKDIFSNTPKEGAGIQLAYRVDPTKEIRMADVDKTLLLNGVQYPAFSNSKDAFDQGYDLFRNAKNQVIVNPASDALERVARPGESRVLSQKEESIYRITGQLPPGSKPLLSGPTKAGETVPFIPSSATEWTNKPLFLNLVSGKESEFAIPVVGDYGKVAATDSSVTAGSETWAHSVDSPLSQASSTSNDYNSRAIWAAARGLKAGDTIHPTDIPMLEQFYREGVANGDWNSWITQQTEKRGISFADDGIHNIDASTSESFLSHIKQVKDEQLQELLANPNTGMGTEEAAIRTNVPESYILNGQKATTSSALTVDPAQWQRTNNVKLWYDAGNVYQQDGMIAKGLIDQQYRIKAIQEQTEAQAASHFGQNWEALQITKGSEAANITGAGNRFLTFARASYGSLAQQAERVQLNLAKFQEQKMASVAKTLLPAAQALRTDATSAAETGAFIAVRHSTGEKFVELPSDLMQEHFPDMFPVDPATQAPKQSGMVAVLKTSLSKDDDGKLQWTRDYLPTGFIDGAASAAGTQGKYNFYKLSETSASWERANQQVNDARIVQRNQWWAANGLSKTLESGTLHAPAIDTSKYPYFALIKDRSGTALSDGGTAIVVARDADTLQQRISGLRANYDVFTKDEIAAHKSAIGDYSADRNFGQSRVNSELARRGILSDIVPDTNPNSIINNYLDFHTRQELALSRDTIESLNGQVFTELKALGDVATTGQTARMGNRVLTRLSGDAPYVENPYDQYIKTALNLKDTDRYQLWHNAQEKVSAFGDQAFAAVKTAFGLASKNQLSWEDASNVATKFGLGNPFSNVVDGLDKYATQTANRLPDRDVLRKIVSAGNSALGATVINLDTFQQMLHVLSTPILLASEGLSVTKSLQQLMTTELPDGTGRTIPAISKVIFNAVKNFWDPAIQAKWMPVYKNLYAIREPGSEWLQDINQLALPYGSKGVQDAADYIHNAVQFGTKWSGALATEHFTSWLAADVGRQLFEAAGQSGRELTDNISSFANRVKGTIIANQRPVAFQGPIGQAIGLFQTYQFNMFQNITRYIENGEGKTLATLFGMQQTLFGMQGLPGFQAINNHIVGVGDPAGSRHGDLYSTTNDFFGKKLGDYLLYGVASNWMNANLYSRSDINPRQISLLPVNPLNYPAISASIRVMGNIADTAKKITDGGNVGSSLLLGLEHNGLNRPLAGLAQLMQGYSTTDKGSLISNVQMPQTMGLSELYSAGIFSRILGARPLDEAISLDAAYRSELYKAKVANQIGALGEGVKTTLYGGQRPTGEQLDNFMSEYSRAGGNIKDFSRHLIDWNSKANTSLANTVFRHMSSPTAQRQMKAMGGQPLPDYRNSSSMEQPPTDTNGQPL